MPDSGQVTSSTGDLGRRGYTMERLVSECTRIIRPGLLEIGFSPRAARGGLTIRSYAIAGRALLQGVGAGNRAFKVKLSPG